MNKLVVISGGTKGIGRALVERFASEGFSVVTTARNEAQLADLQHEIEKKYSVKCYTKAADMSVKSEVNEFVAFIKSLDLSVEVLINNTGFYQPGATYEETDGTLEHFIEANLYSTYYLTKGLIGEMQAQKNGHVFNICSIASLIAYPNSGSYSISKFAMLGFSKVLREEMKPFGIRVTSVMPGATFTDSWAGVPIDENRLMPASDIAETVWSAYKLSKRSVIEDIVIRPLLGDL